MNRNVLEPFFSTIFQLLFTKLFAQPSDSFKLRFARFYHLVSAKPEYGADFFISQADMLQQNVFTPIYADNILPASEQLVKLVDRKLAVISFAKSMGDSKAFAERYKNKGWRWTCEAMLKMLANAPQVAQGVGDDFVNDHDVDDIGFGIGFTPLNTCKKVPRDPFAEVQDINQWVRQYLMDANARHNGAIASYMDRLTDEGKQALALYVS